MIKLATGLQVPDSVVTESLGILAARGAGKSNTAAVLVEELDAAGFPWLVIDPKGDWWGIRAGKQALKVPIFGGLRGDLLLDPGAGVMMAELVHDRNLPCLLDVSEFDSKGQQTRFLTEFGERLFRLQGRSRQPRHVVLEEADDVIPQRVFKEIARCVGIWTKIVKQGRQRAIGITVVSQRSAVVNKDALTQIGTLIVLRTTGPQDQDAIAGWVRYHAVGPEILASLPSLADGEAWVCSPHFLKVVDRFVIRRRRTFDSGATPTTTASSAPTTRLADIDLGALQTEMADTVERAAQEDPAVLRKRIKQLERQLTDLDKNSKSEIERVEVPVPVGTPEQIKTLAAISAAWEGSYAAQMKVLASLKAWQEHFDEQMRKLAATPSTLERLQQSAAQRAPRARPRPPAPASPPPRPESARSPGSAAASNGEDPSRESARQRVLDALAWWRAAGISPASRLQVAMVAGYHPRTPSFTGAIAEMRDEGLIGLPRAGALELLSAGSALAAEPLEPSSDAELQDMILRQVGELRGRMLRVILAADEYVISRAELADEMGYHPRTPNFTGAIAGLKNLGLIEFPRAGQIAAAPTLFLQAVA